MILLTFQKVQAFWKRNPKIIFNGSKSTEFLTDKIKDLLKCYICGVNVCFRGGNAYGSDKNSVQLDIDKMKAKEEELDNLISNTGMI